MTHQKTSAHDQERRDDESREHDSSARILDAQKQIWESTIKSDKIKPDGQEAYLDGKGCVELLTAKVEEGEASWAYQCKKEDGKCKDCTVTVHMYVSTKTAPVTKVAEKYITIVCRKV